MFEISTVNLHQTTFKTAGNTENYYNHFNDSDSSTCIICESVADFALTNLATDSQILYDYEAKIKGNYADKH